MKRPDIPARTIVLAAIKLRHQKKASSISSNGIDLHTMTAGGRCRGIEELWPRVRGYVEHRDRTEGGWTKSNSPPGTDDKARFPKRKIVWPFFLGRSFFVVEKVAQSRGNRIKFHLEETFRNFWPDRWAKSARSSIRCLAEISDSSFSIRRGDRGEMVVD